MAKKDYERGQSLISKYVWVVNTIYHAGRISFEELNEKWLDDEISNGKSIPKRTFDNWRQAILDMFGVFIDNEHKGEYCYFIQNEDDIKNNGIRSWIYNTYSVTNTLASCLGIKDRILLEYVPSGQEYLQTIIDAMKENREIRIIYYNHWKDEEFDLKLQPLCVRLFRQRWYVIALNHYTDLNEKGPRIYSLEHIKDLQVRDETFKMPKDWNAEEYFEGSFGVIRDFEHDKELVKLKVSASQANYIRGLRLHKSQKEVERNDEYSIFTLFIRPTQDFLQELLWHFDNMEVLEPKWLREEMAETTERMFNLYKKD